MVPPSLHSDTRTSAPQPASAQKPDERMAGSRRPIVDPQIPIITEKRAEAVHESEINSPGEPGIIERGSPETPFPEKGVTASLPAGGNTPSLTGEFAPRVTAVEHREFVEEEAASTISAEPPDEPDLHPTVITETVDRPRFFAKTAEIIEKGEAAPADISTILFQEVRQWVASGPSKTEPPAATPEALETLTVRDNLRKETEPGTVVIRERIEQERSSEPAALAEQNFDLSIGTISVIIEDPEKAPEPVRAIQNERSQNNSSGTKREFSRLSRNYL